MKMTPVSAYERAAVAPEWKALSGVERVDTDRAILRSWTEDGTLILEAGVNADREYEGCYRSWWDNWVLKEEGTFRRGKRVGTYRWYLESGEIWSEHNYD